MYSVVVSLLSWFKAILSLLSGEGAPTQGKDCPTQGAPTGLGEDTVMKPIVINPQPLPLETDDYYRGCVTDVSDGQMNVKKVVGFSPLKPRAHPYRPRGTTGPRQDRPKVRYAGLFYIIILSPTVRAVGTGRLLAL